VEQYIRTHSGTSGIQSAFVYAGFYTTNWINFPPLAAPYRTKDGRVLIESAIRADVALPVIDIDADFGQFVAPLFLDPARYNGAKILAAGEYLTVPQMAVAYTKVTGEKVTITRIAVESVGMEELKKTQQLFNAFGYYGGELLEPSHQLYDHLKLHPFEDWLKRTKFTAKPRQQ